jgi:integrase
MAHSTDATFGAWQTDRPTTGLGRLEGTACTAGVRDARVHDARHTAGTLLIEQGVHPRVVMEILGHSDLQLTQRYTHASTAMAAEAAERMNRALWGTN